MLDGEAVEEGQAEAGKGEKATGQGKGQGPSGTFGGQKTGRQKGRGKEAGAKAAQEGHVAPVGG
jgi:hypothetical protein